MKDHLAAFVINLLDILGQVLQFMRFETLKQRNSRQTLCFFAQV
jgi:hypothetical protein